MLPKVNQVHGHSIVPYGRWHAQPKIAIAKSALPKENKKKEFNTATDKEHDARISV
jgi:hypothetical protein